MRFPVFGYHLASGRKNKMQQPLFQLGQTPETMREESLQGFLGLSVQSCGQICQRRGSKIEKFVGMTTRYVANPLNPPASIKC